MEFPRESNKKSRSRGGCSVINCGSKKKTSPNLSFHRVPDYKSSTVTRFNMFGKLEVVDKRKEWLRRLNIKFEPKKELLVCSLHFTKEDYYLPDLCAKTRVLRRNAVPIAVNEQNSSSDVRQERRERRDARKSSLCEPQQRIFNDNQQQSKSSSEQLPTISSYKQQQQTVSSDQQQHTVISDQQQLIEPPSSEPQPNNFSDETLLEPTSSEKQPTNFSDQQPLESSSNIESQPTSPNGDNDQRENLSGLMEPEFHDPGCEFFEIKCLETATQSVQVTSGDFLISFTNFITSEQDLITMCNIKSFEILNELVELMDEIYPPQRKRHFSTEEAIILTTAKLKLDIPFKALAILFNRVTSETISRLFYDTLKKLSTILQCVIQKVSKDEIERNMPKCFQNYRDTVGVYDCTEIKIQTPSCLKCKLKFYSHYKGSLTVKFMTEVTPAGLITFVSESYGGRSHDKNIFTQSGVLHNFECTRDAVMVDKGFLISDECAERRIKLHRPPFLRNKTQFSEAEATRNRTIASARVHIERMNQRIKVFQILNHTVPWYMVHHIDDIFAVCCGLANLGTPILADDKFF